MGTTQYIIITLILAVTEALYFVVARKYHIGNDVTPRSSHNEFKITGGGIIFYIASIVFYTLYGGHLPQHFGLMLIGASLLALVSFYDDIRSLPPGIRLIVHIVVVAGTFYQLLINGHYDIYLLLLICGVGFINAFNFMDGINGILAGYTLVTLSTISYCFYSIPNQQTTLGLQSFTTTLIISAIIFGVLNFRKKAVCFAGDVGAIVMGFFILYLMTQLILTTSDATMVIFLIVYAVDSVFTIFQRLFAGENIFLPHRLHLYQVLSNQWKIKHYKVALAYTLTQLAINVTYLLLPHDLRLTYFIIVTIILTIIYFILKRAQRSKVNL